MVFMSDDKHFPGFVGRILSGDIVPEVSLPVLDLYPVITRQSGSKRTRPDSYEYS
jgi:hypothetical protein